MPGPRLCLYFRTEPERDRWLPGDRFIRPTVRRMVRGNPRAGGVEKVFNNLCRGLDRIGTPFEINPPFCSVRADDRVGVLGRGRYSLDGYDRPNPIVAGIGLMTHPSEWPTLCAEYPVVRYLQHSEWANDVYKPYFGHRCGVWPVGIDTDVWRPTAKPKDIDVLIYNKVHWERERLEDELIQPVRDRLKGKRLTYRELRYGGYREEEYRALLARSRSVVYLSEHESQGLACQECLASNVPVLAWDQGWYLDPNRFKWGQSQIHATSVPYFDERCGERFTGPEDLDEKLSLFWNRVEASAYSPREFVVEHLTLEGCARQFLSFFER